MKKTEKRAIGDKYEEYTADMLRKQGYRILERGYTYKNYETDIIALKDKTVVFTEVKSGSTRFFEDPETRIDIKKAESLVRSAKAYIFSLKSSGIDTDALSFRFDAAAVEFDGDKVMEYRYYENYFICKELNI